MLDRSRYSTIMLENFANLSVPVLGFVGFSGSGKTTLLTNIIPVLSQRGIAVAVLKHAHHQFDVDKPGKDSYEIRKTGAQQVLVASRKRWALMVENPVRQEEPNLEYLLRQLDCSTVDLVLVEGFKTESHEKIEVHRQESEQEFLYLSDPNIIAIATDVPSMDVDLPLLDINDPGAICNFIESHTGIVQK